jgi:hypothetical protein
MEKANKVFVNNGVEAVIAEYKEQIVDEYKNNPFIEALPDILCEEEVIDKLAVYPKFDEKEKNLEPQYRYHIIQRLFQYFQPLNQHLDLESRISRAIRQGYTYRNPFNSEYAVHFKEGYKMIVNGNIESSNNQRFISTGSSFTLVGVSGMGKSTAVNSILSMYPQVIVHNEYKGFKFSMYQVVYLKLDCPHDGSTKGLCIDFMKKTDLLIGTNYYNKYGTGRYAVNVLMPIMGQIARNTGLGLLVIDEIQHLSQAKSGGADNMLNFFVTLINTIGIPVVLIGTMKAMSVLQSQFRQARRGSGQGDMVWGKMLQDENWELLLEGIWSYQFTKKFTPLTEEIRDTLYEFSQGVTDIAIKIIIMSQIRAISSGKEEITVDIMGKVANENLQLVKPMLDALREGNLNKIIKFDDIYSVNIDNFLSQEKSKVSLNNKIRELQSIKKQKRF